MIGLQGYGDDSSDEDVVETKSEQKKDLPEAATASGSDTAQDQHADALRSDPSRLTNRLPALSAAGVKEEDEQTIRQYLAAQRGPQSFDLSEDIRSKKDFGNPVLLTKVVEYFHIQERGSNF